MFGSNWWELLTKRKKYFSLPYAPVLPKLYNLAENWLVAIYLGHFLGIDKASDVQIMIRTGMENHIYRFHNKLRIQKSGGPIGLALTGEVADCYMLYLGYEISG